MAEFFNAFNRPQLRQPNMNFGRSLFGRITRQENYNSLGFIQFGLKIHFLTPAISVKRELEAAGENPPQLAWAVFGIIWQARMRPAPPHARNTETPRAGHPVPP